MNRFSVFNRAVFSPPNEGAAGAPAGGATGSGSTGSSSPPSASPASAAPTIAPGGPQPPPDPSNAGSTTREDASPGDASLDFQSIFDGPSADPVFPGSEPAPPVVAPAVGVPPAAAPVVPAPAAPAAAQPPVVQPAAPGDGGQPPAATPPASGQSPALDLYDPAVLAQGILSNEQATIDHVAATMFALTPEEVQALETDTVGTVQRLCARTFVKTNANMLMQLSKLIPTMIQRGLEDTKRATTNEDSFYAAWPQLNKAQHRDIVNRYGVAFRQMNPNVSKEEMINLLGPLVMMAAKIPFTGTPAPVAGGTAQPQVHPAAGSPPAASVRPPPQSPFVPAVPGPAANGQAPELEPWEAMFAGQ